MPATTTQILITNPVLIFFIVLVIILLAPILLKRLKIPHIVGLIIAGMIVGPYGFQILDRDSSFEIFGQVGILYLMFLAGIEIDMHHLKKNLGRGFAFGVFTFSIPMLIGTIVSYYLLKMDMLSSVLLASMFASHTLIAYPIVARFGVLKNKTVVTAITGTILTDLCALIVLAVIIGIYVEGTLQIGSLVKLLGGLAIYMIAMVYTYPRITRWFFKKYNDKVLQFLFVLSLVFLAGTVSMFIGIEPVLGAFFAGLVLNRYIPNSSPLMNRIEFVGNALFIPYFLIGVGMLINVRSALLDWDSIFVSIVMTVVATLCKWLAAWATQKTYRMTSVDRNILFGLSNAQAAATLAAVMIGYKVGIFSEVILNGSIIMILVTCTIASFVTEKAAAKMKLNMLEEENDESENVSIDRNYRRTLISVSNPQTIQGLVGLAILSRGTNKENSLFGLHVRNNNSPNAEANAHTLLTMAEQTASATDVNIVSIDRYDLNTATGILNTVNERNITDVIIGMHQKNVVVDSFFGSKIEQIINQVLKTIIISRCFIPLNTITRIVVSVPAKAEYETGFRNWVTLLANIAKQIGCRIIFCSNSKTKPYIRGILYEENYEIRDEYRDMENWDDFVLLANKILDDDLFVVIGARRTSISFDSDMDNMQGFLSKYFSYNNLLIIYPEQFGESPQLTSFIDPLDNDMSVKPSGAWLRMRIWYKWLILQKKKITHKNRRNNPKIDL